VCIEVLGVSGHRPKAWGYHPDGYDVLKDLIQENLEDLKPRLVLTGMALGMDVAVAEVCVEVGIPFNAIVPMSGQPLSWNPQDRLKYYRLMEKAASTVVLFEDTKYDPKYYMARNGYIVDRSDYLLVLWNGKNKGGTYDALRRASETSLGTRNMFQSFRRELLVRTVR